MMLYFITQSTGLTISKEQQKDMLQGAKLNDHEQSIEDVEKYERVCSDWTDLIINWNWFDGCVIYNDST